MWVKNIVVTKETKCTDKEVKCKPGEIEAKHVCGSNFDHENKRKG